jgi:uncharacterized protein involved in type VI secretion and phage assembly
VNLLDLLADHAGRDARTPRLAGVAVGIVTNNQDPDNLGRVKLRFPWLADDDESQWARMTGWFAGNDRGGYALPEVDDEVLVAFELGDIHAPYVLGGLWNGVDKPPRDNADGANNVRVIRSRSGHELIFNDEQQKEQVELHTKAGHTILLDDSAGQEKITITDKSGSNSIQIDSVQNAVTIAGQMKISLKAQIIEIEAGSMMTIKAGATLTIQGALVQIN